MKKQIISLLLLVGLTVFSCKKDKETDNDNPKDCDLSSFNGTWVFVKNKNQANQYLDTIKFYYANNTLELNLTIAERMSNNNTYVTYQNNELDEITIFKKDCNIQSNGWGGYKIN